MRFLQKVESIQTKQKNNDEQPEVLMKLWLYCLDTE